MTELQNHQVVSVKGTDTTPSLLYNNLSLSDTLVTYVHKNDVVMVDIAKPDAPVITHPLSAAAAASSKAKTAVYQARVVRLGSRLVLVVATTSSVQFWDAEKESMLGEVTAPDSKDLYLSRGLGVLGGKGDNAMVFLGHSNGSISVVDFQGTECSLIKSITRHSDNISDITAGDAEGVGVVIASADISGEMVLWGEDLSETGKVSFPGDTCTSVHVTGAYVAASFGSGLIRLYHAKGASLFAEIAAHARWITAITVNPGANLMASVSEDMLLCLWRTPCKENGGKVQLLAHKLLKDCLLTGVQFTDDGRRLITSAYDWDRLHMVDVP